MMPGMAGGQAGAVAPDVIVVGLGAMGSMALWQLAARGARVLGFEQFEPGHDRGSSHGESRIIRTAYFEGPAYVPLARAAWTRWQALEAATGTPLLVPSGGLMVGTPDSSVVAGTLAAAAEHELPVRRLDTTALRAEFPQHVVADGVVAVAEQEAGVLRPEAGVRAAVTAARGLGAAVQTGSAVTAVLPDADRPGVLAGGREVRARHVVVTAGAWLGRLVPQLAGTLRVVRRVMAWFPVDDPTAYAPGRFGVFVRDDGDGPAWYGFPSMDGRTVKFALHHGDGLDEIVDAATGARAAEALDEQRLTAFARRLSGVSPRPERMATCMYTMTPDENFLVGRRRDLPGVTLLGGFSGHGYKFAPVLGSAAADLALDGGTTWDLSLFDPGRFETARL